MACVYKHTNKINGKVYIGYTTMKRPEQRWRSDGSGYSDRGQTYFSNAIKKYGWDCFTHEILIDGLTEEEAKKKEIEYIAKYDSNNPEKGYNTTEGGEGCRPSPLARKHLSEAHKGLSYPNRKGYTPTEEHRHNISNTLKGRSPWNKGKKIGPLSEETRKKIGDARRGKKMPTEVVERVRQANLGRTPWNKGSKGIMKAWNKGIQTGPLSETQKIKLSLAHKGQKPTQKAMEASRLKSSKPVRCIETGEVYPSATAAAKALGLSTMSNISECALGHRPRCGGYRWEYI